MTARAERATLAQIASAAGVSVATVSKVLNGRPDVAPGTRSHVERMLRDLSYEPRRVERPRTQSVAMLFHGPLMTYSMEILEGVLAAAGEIDTDVVVARTDIGGDSARERASANCQAVIAVTSAASDLAKLTQAHIPTVVIDPVGVPSADVVSVGSTNFSGGTSATQHLLDLGHRRIGFVCGPAASACSRARLQGYRGAMDAAGIRVPKGYLREGNFEYADGLRAGAALLDLPQPPTAIFAANDEMALGILEAARTRGVRVPTDLSLIGFDDTEVARVSSPPLTTIAQPLRRMGAVALRTALRLAAGGRVDSHHVELATELVIRESTAPLVG